MAEQAQPKLLKWTHNGLNQLLAVWDVRTMGSRHQCYWHRQEIKGKVPVGTGNGGPVCVVVLSRPPAMESICKYPVPSWWYRDEVNNSVAVLTFSKKTNQWHQPVVNVPLPPVIGEPLPLHEEEEEYLSDPEQE